MPVGATRKHLEHLAFWGLVAGTALLGTVETLVILKGGTNVGCLVSSQRPPHSQVHWTWRVVHRQEDSEHRPPHQAMAHHPGSHFRPGAAECGFGAATGRPASPVPVPEDGHHVHVLQECAFPE